MSFSATSVKLNLHINFKMYSKTDFHTIKFVHLIVRVLTSIKESYIMSEHMHFLYPTPPKKKKKHQSIHQYPSPPYSVKVWSTLFTAISCLI